MSTHKPSKLGLCNVTSHSPAPFTSSPVFCGVSQRHIYFFFLSRPDVRVWHTGPKGHRAWRGSDCTSSPSPRVPANPPTRWPVHTRPHRTVGASLRELNLTDSYAAVPSCIFAQFLVLGPCQDRDQWHCTVPYEVYGESLDRGQRTAVDLVSFSPAAFRHATEPTSALVFTERLVPQMGSHHLR